MSRPLTDPATMWKKNFNFPLLNVKISDSGNPNHLTTVSLGKNLENFGTVDFNGDIISSLMIGFRSLSQAEHGAPCASLQLSRQYYIATLSAARQAVRHLVPTCIQAGSAASRPELQSSRPCCIASLPAVW